MTSFFVCGVFMCLSPCRSRVLSPFVLNLSRQRVTKATHFPNISPSSFFLFLTASLVRGLPPFISVLDAAGYTLFTTSYACDHGALHVG